MKTLPVIIATVVGIVSVVSICAYYNIEQQKIVSQAVIDAAAKGIEPLAIRCALTNNSDSVCLIYASGLNQSQKVAQ